MENISLEAIDHFLTYLFFNNKNCNNSNCLVHNVLNILQQKIDQEENKDAKGKIFVEHCKENVPVFFTIEHNYTSTGFLHLTEIKSVYSLQNVITVVVVF